MPFFRALLLPLGGGRVWATDICVVGLFCTKFNSKQLLFEAFFSCNAYFWQRSIQKWKYSFHYRHYYIADIPNYADASARIVSKKHNIILVSQNLHWIYTKLNYLGILYYFNAHFSPRIGIISWIIVHKIPGENECTKHTGTIKFLSQANFILLLFRSICYTIILQNKYVLLTFINLCMPVKNFTWCFSSFFFLNFNFNRQYKASMIMFHNCQDLKTSD